MVAVPLLCASLAQASEPRFYLTATVGTGDENPKSNGINVSDGLSIVHVDPEQVTVDDGSLAWGVGVGYRFNPYLAAEVEYADFGTTDVREHYFVTHENPIPFFNEFDLDYSSKVTGPVLSVLGTLPVGGSFELFLRGGALFASREYSMHGPNASGGPKQKFASTVWLAGAGASWSFAERWGMRAEYQQAGALDESLVTGETRLKRMSLSVLYRF